MCHLVTGQIIKGKHGLAYKPEFARFVWALQRANQCLLLACWARSELGWPVACLIHLGLLGGIATISTSASLPDKGS